MRKLYLSCLFSIPFFAAAQLPCSQLPTAASLMQQMKTRPVMNIRPRIFSEKCNVTDSIKKRIIQLLDWRWTKEELDNFYARRIDTTYINKLAKGNKAVRDSLYTKFKWEEQDMLAQTKFRVDGNLILVPAKLYMKEALPILRRSLLDSVHYDKSYVLLALARLGEKEAESKALAAYVPNNALSGREWASDAMKKVKPLLFVCSQESIAAVGKFLDPAQEFAVNASSSRVTKSSADVVFYLSNLILNQDFQQYANWKEAYNYETIDDKLINYCKEWLNKNKGKYELNKEYTLY